MDIRYRPGKREDSEKIAEFINTASGGVVEYLFHDLVPGMSTVQMVTDMLKNDHYPHTYNSAIVALDGNTVVGIAFSYPAVYHTVTKEMKDLFPADRLAHLSTFFSRRVEDSWFLDTLCIAAEHHRRGIGKTLISRTKEVAARNGYAKLSLIVFADNAPALSLYERAGFSVVQEVALTGNAFIQHEGGCLLLCADIAT